MTKNFHVFAIYRRPEIDNDVISGVAVDNVSMDVPIKFCDSSSNGFRDIRGADFVSMFRLKTGFLQPSLYRKISLYFCQSVFRFSILLFQHHLRFLNWLCGWSAIYCSWENPKAISRANRFITWSWCVASSQELSGSREHFWQWKFNDSTVKVIVMDNYHNRRGRLKQCKLLMAL